MPLQKEACKKKKTLKSTWSQLTPVAEVHSSSLGKLIRATKEDSR